MIGGTTSTKIEHSALYCQQDDLYAKTILSYASIERSTYMQPMKLPVPVNMPLSMSHRDNSDEGSGIMAVIHPMVSSVQIN